MPPANKRARIGERSTSPAPTRKTTVFASPGLTPDVLIEVFDEDFYVHSVILKLHSNYFRRFLESPEKGKREGERWRFHYTTAVDDDGTWALEPSETANPLTPSLMAKVESPALETKAFCNIMRAMYNRPYEVIDIENLRVLIRLSDFYCALPIVSNTITAGLLRSRIFQEEIYSNGSGYVSCCELILMAKQLRNIFMFRECFVHVVAAYDPEELNDNPFLPKDTEILILVQIHHAILCQRIMRAQQYICHALMKGQFSNTRFSDRLDLLAEGTENRPFYEYVQHELYDRNIIDMGELKDELDELLVCNLVVNQAYVRGRDYFLCTQIDEHDMPWDAEEIDW